MKQKPHTFTEADLYIVKSFGDSVKEIYGDDYAFLKKTAENLEAKYDKNLKEEATRVFEKLRPKFEEYRAYIKSKKENEKEIIEAVRKNNEPSMADKILAAISSINNGIRDITGMVSQGSESIMQDIFAPISLVITGAALSPITSGAVRGAAKKAISFRFIGEQEREGLLIAEEETVRIEIPCKDPGKVFYLIGNYDIRKLSPGKDIVSFPNINPGYYILSEDLKWHKGIVISSDTVDK